MNRGTHARILKLETRGGSVDEPERWVRVIVRQNETKEEVLARHFRERPEDCGANVILRMIT
jgi:hypothetical protein